MKKHALFNKNKTLLTGAVLLSTILMLLLFVPLIRPTDPNAMEVSARLSGPDINHPFGTDEFGRDLFARVLYGGRVSFLVGSSVALLSCFFGTILGIYSGYYSLLDHVLMRVCEGFMAIPGILLAIALSVALGPSSRNIILSLTIVYTPSVARIVRANTLVVKSLTFVEASKVIGAHNPHILWKIIFPNLFSTVVVQASFIFAQSIIAEAALSFLGAGIPAPAASLGNILESSRNVLYKAPWTVIFPGLWVILSVLSLHLLGDGLRDYLLKGYKHEK